MARKILVVNDNSHVKKSVALFLIRRVLADWEVEGLSIRRRPVRAFKHACAVSNEHPAKPYIPEKMPPREIPGVYFKPPERKPIMTQQQAAALKHRYGFTNQEIERMEEPVAIDLAERAMRNEAASGHTSR